MDIDEIIAGGGMTFRKSSSGGDKKDDKVKRRSISQGRMAADRLSKRQSIANSAPIGIKNDSDWNAKQWPFALTRPY